MKKLLPILLFAFGLTACGPHLTTNEYRDAKTHPSEEIQKGHKKATKQGKKDFKKNMKKADKAGKKRNAKFFKKKKSR